MSESKRIALFSVTYDPFIGGAEVAIKEITDRLGDFEFDLFTARLDSKLPEQARIGNVNVYRIGSGHPLLDKWLYPWRASRLALKMHAQKPYDLIHAVMATYAGFAAMKFKKKESGVPYVLTLQSGDSDWFIRMRTWFWYPWYRQIYTKADKVTAISNWLAYRAKRYGCKKNVEIIPNGVDVDLFGKELNPDERSSIRENWGAKDTDFVVITTSRLVHKNGIDILIDAMADFSSGVKLIIAGEGKLEKKLKSRASKFGDRIIFLGQIRHNELPKLLKSSDIYVRPSRSEGMGNSFVEAMLAGLPVLGTRVGGILDLIKKKIVIGIKKDNPSASDVAIDIRTFKNNKQFREEVSRHAHAGARREYNWDYISNQYNQEYQKLIK